MMYPLFLKAVPSHDKIVKDFSQQIVKLFTASAEFSLNLFLFICSIFHRFVFNAS